VKTAFQTARVSDGDEQDYVNKLRKSGNYIPELALVIKDGAHIIGHIMLTKTLLIQGEERLETLLLSPICTRLEYRNQGIGSKLIRYALAKAKELGYPAVFLVGNPVFYIRFCFRSIADFGIRETDKIPVEYIMGLELEQDFLGAKGGSTSIYEIW
jgi:predicted N-acetyltransferase YhbS